MSFHGSAVAWPAEDRAAGAIALLGPSGAGKSTLAAALTRFAGAKLVADDHVVLEPRGQGFIVHPSYASVRVWRDAAAALFDEVPARGDKIHLAVPPVGEPVPLRTIFLLDPDPEADELVRLEPLRPRDALVGLANHVDRLDPTDRSALARELEHLAALTRRVPTARARIGRARGLGALPALAEAMRSAAAAPAT
jgi:hypothetical protein